MPSQKRYRQQQENNNSARFRDLPPRFKRQKSSTPAEEESSSADTIYFESQKSTAANHSLDTKKADSLESLKSQVLMAPSYSKAYSQEEDLSTSTHIIQTPQLVTAAWQCPQKLNPAVILTPWNSRHLDRVTNTQSHVPLGTHFGYKAASPPLTPWVPTDTSHFSGQHVATNSPTWLSSNIDPCTGRQAQNTSGYFNNENWAPTEKVQYPSSSAAAVWCSQSPPPQHSASPTFQSQVGLRSNSNEKVTSLKEGRPNNKQMIDYSDPDIRTIEMLRELERVADEKESECDSFGADRKSLVSHHLRMLMCAVDRYTEGIGDDLSTATRGDELTASDSYLSSPKGSPASSDTWTQKQVKEITREATPASSDTWTQKQVKEITREAPPEIAIPMWSPSMKEPVWTGPPAEPVSSATVHLTVSTPIHEPYFPSPQGSPAWKQQKLMKRQDTTSWDLWSSPSFDFSGVLINQSAEDITRDPFGRFANKNERERKPLYQR